MIYFFLFVKKKKEKVMKVLVDRNNNMIKNKSVSCRRWLQPAEPRCCRSHSPGFATEAPLASCSGCQDSHGEASVPPQPAERQC